MQATLEALSTEALKDPLGAFEHTWWLISDARHHEMTTEQSERFRRLTYSHLERMIALLTLQNIAPIYFEPDAPSWKHAEIKDRIFELLSKSEPFRDADDKGNFIIFDQTFNQMAAEVAEASAKHQKRMQEREMEYAQMRLEAERKRQVSLAAQAAREEERKAAE